jgi:hypothetical protein
MNIENKATNWVLISTSNYNDALAIPIEQLEQFFNTAVFMVKGYENGEVTWTPKDSYPAIQFMSSEQMKVAQMRAKMTTK